MQTARSAADRQVVALNFASMTQHGMILLLVGPMLPNIMVTFGVGESLAGLLLAMGALGFLCGPLIAGAVIDRVNVRAALRIGFLIEFLILCVYGLSPVFGLAVAAHFVMLLGSSFVETSANVMPSLTRTGRPAHAAMNLVHMFFSVGAFVGPFLIGLYLEATGEWRPIMFFALVPTGVLLLWTTLVRFPGRKQVSTDAPPPGSAGETSLGDASPKAAAPGRSRLGTVIRRRSVLLGALTLMLYVGAEVGTSSWVVYYLQRELGMSAVASASGLSILWVCILAGRFANSVLGNRFSSRSLVTVSGLTGAAGVVLFLFARSAASAYPLLGLIGLCFSGVFPNVMGELNRRDPRRVGTVTAVMAMGAAAGAGLFQWFLGFLAETVSLTAAFVTPAILQVLFVITFQLAVRSE